MVRLKSGKKRWQFLMLRILLYGLMYLCFFGMVGLSNWQLWAPSRTSGVTLLTFTVLLAVMLSVYGGYDIGKRKSKPVISSLVLAVGMTDIVTYLQLEIMNVNDAKNAVLTLFGVDFLLLACAFVLQIAAIVLFTRFGNSLYFSVHPPEKCCVVASSREAAARVAEKLRRYRLQYDVRDMAKYNAWDIKDRIQRSDTVFFADVPAGPRAQLLEYCYEQQKNVYTTADVCDVMVANGRQVVLDDCPFVAMGRGPLEPHELMVKRAIDVVVSLAALVILSPVMLVISAAILLEDGLPVFFRQKRMTAGGEVFNIIKFRTMRKGIEESGAQVSATQGDGRITRMGGLLRKWRLDETPQFWNILRGDMSLVGPRAEMLENVAQYSREFPAFMFRYRMKAGLTGHAQIEGRYNTCAKDKLMMDLMYIEGYSIWQDIKLLFRTLTVFFKTDSTEGFAAQPWENGAPPVPEEDAAAREPQGEEETPSASHSAIL